MHYISSFSYGDALHYCRASTLTFLDVRQVMERVRPLADRPGQFDSVGPLRYRRGSVSMPRVFVLSEPR
jgi:hypothetical protein